MSGRARRVFFAAWPSPRWCAALQERAAGPLEAASKLGRAVAVADWHATLCFLGSVEPGPLASLRGMAAGIDAEGFALQFDRLEYWPHGGLLCLTAQDPQGPVLELVERLRSLARTAGLAADERPFLAHLTLARGLAPMRGGRGGRGGAATEIGLGPIELPPWRAQRFCLAESLDRAQAGGAGQTGRYRLVESWPLRAAPPVR